jgi:LysR family hydrogen peroxide-inducible transcriptional activator
MNLRDLHYLVAVADQRNFSKAANQCAISQPTLSNQIKKLEDLLDVQIFNRDSQNVNMTSVGSQIVDIARKITKDAETIKLIAKQASNINDNKIIMGAFPTLANYVFPEYVFRLKQLYEGMKLTLIEEKTDILIDMLVSSRVDVAFLAMPIEDDRLEGIALFDDPFYVAVSDRHPLADKKEIDIDELINDNLLLLDEGHCLRSQMLKLCSASHNYADDFRAASLETLRVMVKSDIGITLMPSVSIYPGESDIKYIPIKSKPYRTIGLFWKKYNFRKELFESIASQLSYIPVQDEF